MEVPVSGVSKNGSNDAGGVEVLLRSQRLSVWSNERSMRGKCTLVSATRLGRFCDSERVSNSECSAMSAQVPRLERL